MRHRAAAVAATCAFLLIPMGRSVGLPKPNKPPLVEERRKDEENRSVRCQSRTIKVSGNLVGYKCIKKGILVALTDRTVEWHIFGPKDGDLDLITGTENKDNGALACNTIADSGKWVGIGRKDGGIALYRYSAGEEGTLRHEAKTGFTQLKRCELREFEKGSKAGKDEQIIKIATDYDDKPIEIALKKIE